MYDGRAFFKSHGISSPEGALALFIENDGLLFVKNTAANIDLIETLGFAVPVTVPMLLRNEIVVVRFNSSARNPDRPVPTLVELRNAAGDSWTQLCAMEIRTRSGETVKARNSTGIIPQENGETGPVKAPEMQPNDIGASCAIESILGPDGSTIDCTLSFRFQSPKEKGAAPLAITYNGSSTLWDGQPQILQYLDGSGDGTAYAR